MQTDGSLGRIRAEAVSTAWGNSMEWVVAVVVIAGAGWWWWHRQ